MLGKGILFTAIGQYSNILIQLVVNVVLSRMISVEEFGVVATIQVFLIFFQMLVTSGFGPAIIQNKELIEEDYAILFNFLFIFSLIFAILFGVSGGIVSIIYDNQIYRRLFWLMSIIVFSEGMKVVTTAVLNKRLQFKKINLTLLVSNIIGAICGISTAFMGFGVYALIISTAVPSFLSMILNIYFAKIPIILKLQVKPLKAIWGFTRNQLGFTVLNYFSRNSDNLLIGKLLGPIPLANYQKSYQLITMPNTVFLGIISPVLQPVLSNHQDDTELIRKTFLQIIHVLGLIAFPLTIFMAFNSKEIIMFLFGERWLNAVIPFSILSCSIWAQMLTSATGSIFMARNHSKNLFLTGVISTILIVSLTLLGIFTQNINKIAAFICLAYILNFFTSYCMLMRRVLEGTIIMVVKELIKPFIIGLISLLPLVFTSYLLSINSYFFTLIVRGIFWVSTLIICCLISGEVNVIRKFFN